MSRSVGPPPPEGTEDDNIHYVHFVSLAWLAYFCLFQVWVEKDIKLTTLASLCLKLFKPYSKFATEPERTSLLFKAHRKYGLDKNDGVIIYLPSGIYSYSEF